MFLFCTGYFYIRFVLLTWQNPVLLTASVKNTVWHLKNYKLLFFFLLQNEESFAEKHLLKSLHYRFQTLPFLFSYFHYL